MNFFLIPSGVYSGKLNMEVDNRIADQCGRDEAFLRFYEWDPYCISIGRNQNFEDVNDSSVSEEKIDIVKRPTGGRAVLHAEELTYSFVLSNSFGLSRNEIYILVSKAIIYGLRKYDPLLERVMLNDTQPDFSNFYKTPQGAICFAAASKSEVKFENKKADWQRSKRIEKFHSAAWLNFMRELP